MGHLGRSDDGDLAGRGVAVDDEPATLERKPVTRDAVLAELEGKGLADLPGGRFVVLEDDDGSAEADSLAAQEA